MLLEHDAKSLLAARGLPVPPGVLARAGERLALAPPLAIKAQVPVGGRGKAGGIRLARTAEAVQAALDALLGMTIKGHAVHAVRAEAVVDFAAEAYLSLALDPGPGKLRVMMSARGGIDVEDARDDVLGESVDCDVAAAGGAIERLSARLPGPLRAPLRDAGTRLAGAFFALEAILIEINPLFIAADGAWIIGDAKLAIDENALPRQPALRAIIADNPDLYPEAALKLDHGFDFVRLDPDGDIGLVTTGAGLSMQLIDELIARGRRPFNFCDIRTGQFRGDPARLIQVLRWIAAGPRVRSVLINFFAGHTDLNEIADLLVAALAAVPHLTAPVTARLIGNGLEGARAKLAAAGAPIAIETDLERAIDLAIDRADRASA